MTVIFRDGVVNDMLWLCNDLKLRRRVDRIIKELERDPYSAFAKSEQLKGCRAGQYSMRIDEKHRIIYTIKSGIVEIIQCGEHYDD